MLHSEDPFQSGSNIKYSLKAKIAAILVGILVIIAGSYAFFGSGHHVTDCKRPQIYPLYYVNGSFDKTTMVLLCRTEDYLLLEWRIQDSEIISPYQNCHDPVYRADSVGVMLESPLYRFVSNYYSFIISPKSLVYSEDISPYYNTHTHIFDCNEIQARIKLIDNGWEARLQIPIQKIGKGYIMATDIINFFRVDIDNKKNKRLSFYDRSNVDSIKNYILETAVIQNQQKNQISQDS